MNKRVFLCFILLLSIPFKGQGRDFDIIGSKDSGIQTEKTEEHSPTKASIYSAVLPGLGQIYNKKYWKTPIVLSAIGISGYYIFKNRSEMRETQNALIARLDGDSSTVEAAKFLNVPTSSLKAQRDLSRSYRDYSIIICTGFYLLNIVDAAVDAHFYNFNIDKPLAEQRKKNWHLFSSMQAGTNTVGLRLNF
jgi:hypothetical protein